MKFLYPFLILFIFVVDGREVIAQNNSPVLVELFTAEDCPACPPADVYLAKLAKSPNVIALACHVHYFGKGTADLGRRFCTQRQATYAAQLGQKKYYTPQMIINGTVDEIGYKSSKVAAKITQAQKDPTKAIKIVQKAPGVYDLMIPPARLSRSANLWLAVYNKETTINKRGRKMTFTNVVDYYTPLGDWNGQALQKAIFPLTNSKSAGFVVAAQDERTGKIFAVGEFKF